MKRYFSRGSTKVQQPQSVGKILPIKNNNGDTALHVNVWVVKYEYFTDLGLGSF